MSIPTLKKDNNIGTLRFLGAFVVLYGHSYALSGINQIDPVSPWLTPYSPWHQPMQSLGVILFFVLSEKYFFLFGCSLCAYLPGTDFCCVILHICCGA